MGSHSQVSIRWLCISICWIGCASALQPFAQSYFAFDRQDAPLPEKPAGGWDGSSVANPANPMGQAVPASPPQPPPVVQPQPAIQPPPNGPSQGLPAAVSQQTKSTRPPFVEPQSTNRPAGLQNIPGKTTPKRKQCARPIKWPMLPNKPPVEASSMACAVYPDIYASVRDTCTKLTKAEKKNGSYFWYCCYVKWAKPECLY
ncbi:basic salivary proline-rich protein 1-like [Paramacrobiotus metropolitanus]|uniref:basic salivary proline-rich protein 1-like n=1 Tax=Paramacrobiotus metropolitanus TaxID=2943436 RepID=UPI0024462080|nr:basic salivary proline-rich protein 1-like [Paramacrobiotus metropolitanus]